MALTQSQKALIEKVRVAGSGELGTALSDAACCFIIGVIVKDLRLSREFPEFRGLDCELFAETDPRKLEISGLDFDGLVERLIALVPDADTYFACVATLQKARLKYARILEYQPVSTMDQVGPRALLQFGQFSPRALAVFLLWRKWLFDIDNRAGQETGYLFEPIIAHSIGGVPFSAKASPIKRHTDPSKGRQVDCIRKQLAYEIKIRVTIAASGQGRWQEELDFPLDCRTSGFKPVLVVLDPTLNPKLSELVATFEKEGGDTYVGDAAWRHLEAAAGQVMSVFLDKYVKGPMQQVLLATPDAGELPDITFGMTGDEFSVLVDGEHTAFKRARGDVLETG
ncbi:MAG: restriction endonuclease [Chloroflexi bacterium]|nr:restriction endonuclease [Chloroflexota bacterium]